MNEQNQEWNIQGRRWSKKFVNRILKERTMVVWTFIGNGQNQDTKIRIKIRDPWDDPEQYSSARF